MFFALIALLTLASPGGDARAGPVKLPGKDQTPIFREALPQPGEALPAPKKFFGLGIGFAARGNAQGISLDQVVADSPAERAGWTAGTVIAEINGLSTLGRSREECTQIVRESGNAVTVKFYDPVTFKLRTQTVEKAWFNLPN